MLNIRRKQVLVVEDEDNIATALGYVLTSEGYAHQRIADGALALEHIRSEPPDLVLLDVMLPGLSGFEICRGVRLDAGLAAVRLLVMTARGSPAERRAALDLGADGFISKPFDLAELRAELRRILGPLPA